MTTMKRIATVTPKWPLTSTSPSAENPGVRLIFQGLMVFCHKGKGCDVAFFRDDSHHRLGIKVFENCEEIYATTDVNDPVFIKKVSLGINGKDNDVVFFHEGDPKDFNRHSGHPNDFWWLLDLDHLYGKKLGKEKSFSKTKLSVKHGVFYTYQHTNAKFRGIGGPFSQRVADLGHVAKIMAADITLAEGQSVSLEINDNDALHPLYPNARTKYEIYFNNECWEADGRRCPASDFDLNFEATKLKPEEKFILQVEEGTDRDDAPVGLCISQGFSPEGTDKAPCMGVGFGQGGGMPV